MNMRDLIPWNRSSNRVATYQDSQPNPFLSLHREMNRLFDDAFRSFDSHLPAFGSLSSFGSWPSVEISETDKEIKVTAEIAGLEEKDVEILLDGDVLTLRGEKRGESEDKNKQFSERFYGRFERRIPLGVEVDEAGIEARFKNGVLTVVLPKSANAQSQVKRIPIKH
jgi:HSP20 family protein